MMVYIYINCANSIIKEEISCFRSKISTLFDEYDRLQSEKKQLITEKDLLTKAITYCKLQKLDEEVKLRIEEISHQLNSLNSQIKGTLLNIESFIQENFEIFIEMFIENSVISHAEFNTILKNFIAREQNNQNQEMIIAPSVAEFMLSSDVQGAPNAVNPSIFQNNYNIQGAPVANESTVQIQAPDGRNASMVISQVQQNNNQNNNQVVQNNNDNNIHRILINMFRNFVEKFRQLRDQTKIIHNIRTAKYDNNMTNMQGQNNIQQKNNQQSNLSSNYTDKL